MTRLASLLAWAAQPRVAFAVALSLALIVAVATLTPSVHMPSAPGGDKLHHFLAFGALASTIAYTKPRAFVWIVLAVSTYGGLIEFIQPHVGRHGDVMDALANATGAISGALLGSALNRLFVQ